MMNALSIISRMPQFRRRQPRHAKFLGLPFSLLHQVEVIRLITEQGGAPYRYVVTPNAYHVVTVHDEPERLLPVYQAAWLSLCDSRIVRALARLERLPLPLVTGSDLVATLLAALNVAASDHAPRRILVVGPNRAVGQMLQRIYPNLGIDVMPAPGAFG
jgi:N-acetylglucosaminyldiphosphoundecaprenol N-acetyl-beta-D-mannosaminyltransferase